MLIRSFMFCVVATTFFGLSNAQAANNSASVIPALATGDVLSLARVRVGQPIGLIPRCSIEPDSAERRPAVCRLGPCIARLKGSVGACRSDRSGRLTKPSKWKSRTTIFSLHRPGSFPRDRGPKPRRDNFGTRPNSPSQRASPNGREWSTEEPIQTNSMCEHCLTPGAALAWTRFTDRPTFSFTNPWADNRPRGCSR